MIPEQIQTAISKLGGTIQSCTPVCEGSRHFIVHFSAPHNAVWFFEEKSATD